MDPSQLIPYVTGAGGALVVLLMLATLMITGRLIPAATHDDIVAGKDKQISDLTQAVKDERARADAAILAAQTTNAVLGALHREVTGG